MAMKPFTKYTYDKTIRTYRDGKQLVYPNRVQTTEQLYGVVSVKGDHATPNPHAFTRRVSTNAIGYVKQPFADGSYEILAGVDVASFISSGAEPSTHDPVALEIAKERLWNQVRNGYRSGDDGQRSLDVSVDLIQYRQTMAMANLWRGSVFGLASHGKHYLPIAQRTQELSDRLNRGNIHFDQRARWTREIDRHLDVLANARLQYVYGWKPTVSTFHDLAKVATTPPPGSNGGWVKMEVRGSTKADHERMLGAEPRTRYKGFRSDRAQIVAFFSPKPSILSRMAEIASLNPVSLIYEATPYSFVIDWFSNTGSWLRSVETAMVHGSEYRGGYTSQGTFFTEKISRNGTRGVGQPEYNWTATIDLKKFTRTTGVSVPLIRSPRFEWNFGINQALNATALFKQKFRVFDAVLALRGK